MDDPLAAEVVLPTRAPFVYPRADMLRVAAPRQPALQTSGVILLAVDSIAAGIFDLVWQEFEPAHQPIQALGDHVPGQRALACVVATGLIAGGLGLFWRRSTRAAAVSLAVIYAVFALFWVPRSFGAVRILGLHASLVVGLLDGFGTQLIVVVAAVLLYLRPRQGWSPPPLGRTSWARWTVGLCSIVFGLGHLTAIPAVGTMIPRWMPFSPALPVVLSGIAFLLAGLAILSGVWDVLAGRLQALMLLLFSLLILLPMPFASPHNHVAWGANAYNLAAIGATLIFAEALAAPHGDRPGPASRAI